MQHNPVLCVTAVYITQSLSNFSEENMLLLCKCITHYSNPQKYYMHKKKKSTVRSLQFVRFHMKIHLPTTHTAYMSFDEINLLKQSCEYFFTFFSEKWEKWKWSLCMCIAPVSIFCALLLPPPH